MNDAAVAARLAGGLGRNATICRRAHPAAAGDAGSGAVPLLRAAA